MSHPAKPVQTAQISWQDNTRLGKNTGQMNRGVNSEKKHRTFDEL
jgi:hypothetical protein